LINFKKIIIFFCIIQAQNRMESSSPIVTPEEIRRFQITPLHKVTTIYEIDEILKYGPDVNAMDIMGRTPTDYLLERACRAKKNRDRIKFDHYIEAAKYLASKGGKFHNKNQGNQ